MSELPTGTVSLLFSDIEGSTALLRRLGHAYDQALQVQRQVLRKAWGDHGGTEVGTEGDSFFVVFSTAEQAVAAATQAQRDLAAFAWPAGERVQVRMGIHTGSPRVSDGGYVGMDVHRAARIAGAAHGGQVVVSESTATLAAPTLPKAVEMQDLGSHELKDLPAREHLFQLAVEGLRVKFPPLKSLGTTSRMPRPATPLVGREGELAELTALLSSADVRLVTLTGPGGSGKTRLAIGVAEVLVDRFPHGLYFVPLAAVTTGGVMWTSIAEVLNVPPEGRVPPGFFEHVARRTALFVLDNLEQIDGADNVVAEFLAHAPRVVVIATSRRPLHVPGEVQHAVPPLELPDKATFADAARSGAVQMFVQHARAIRASFTLTSANAADVVTLCQRLDGLPLALELAAARTKLLSPAALLARLDKTLDLTAASSLATARQKTLRDTIAWSYQLLTPTQQALFRCLAVFAGGCDLEAVAAVASGCLHDVDPLDVISDLVDASLVTVTEDDQGEPRVEMLETIRAYALERLHETGELQAVHQLHTQHYLRIAETLHREGLIDAEEQVLASRARFELEHENFSDSLAWALSPTQPAENPSSRIRLGLQLCHFLSRFWGDVGGYLVEGRRWLEHAIDAARDSHSPDAARCMSHLAILLTRQGHYERAAKLAANAVSIERELGRDKELAIALSNLATAEDLRGNFKAAGESYDEALEIAERTGDIPMTVRVLGNLALVAMEQQDLEESLQFAEKALEIATQNDMGRFALIERLLVAEIRFYMGHIAVAHEKYSREIPNVLRLGNLGTTLDVAEVYSCIMAATNHHQLAVHLLGAANATAERSGIQHEPFMESQLAAYHKQSRAALSADGWRSEYQTGRNMPVEEVLRQAVSLTAGSMRLASG